MCARFQVLQSTLLLLVHMHFTDKQEIGGNKKTSILKTEVLQLKYKKDMKSWTFKDVLLNGISQLSKSETFTDNFKII